ncbi:MAG: 50S ribosomal protein L13 [Candidatus Magasanikbacteria bacterium]|nr:50S ribosomal protein L13 [Candidatus Magasanikbacteria bacterium]
MEQIVRTTHVIDGRGQIVGRLATRIANLLNGKHKRNYEPNTDCGDVVAVKNASKLVLTGKKLSVKTLKHHSNYPGGLKEESVARLMKINPEKVLRHAVQFMIPKNRLRKRKLRRLKISV